MGLLADRPQFRSQPKSLLSVDYAGISSKHGLRARPVIVTPYGEHALGARATFPLPRIKPASGMLGFDCPDDNIIRVEYAMPVSSGDMTLVTVFQTASAGGLSAGQAAVGAFNLSGTHVGNYISVETDGKLCAISTDSANWTLATGPTVQTNIVYRVAAVFRAGFPARLYINGSFYSAAAEGRDPTGLNKFYISAYSNNNAVGAPLNGISFMGAVLPFAASEGYAASLSANPWQIFKAPLRIIPAQQAGGTPQYLAPVSDIAAGSWLPSTGSDLYAMLDETLYSDTDYIYTTSATTCTLGIASGVDPAVSTGHTLRYRLLSGSGKIAVTLKQSSTTIASWGPHTLTGAAQDFAQTLTAGEADSITDYSALRVELTSSL